MKSKIYQYYFLARLLSFLRFSPPDRSLQTACFTQYPNLLPTSCFRPPTPLPQHCFKLSVDGNPSVEDETTAKSCATQNKHEGRFRSEIRSHKNKTEQTVAPWPLSSTLIITVKGPLRPLCEQSYHLFLRRFARWGIYQYSKGPRNARNGVPPTDMPHSVAVHQAQGDKMTTFALQSHFSGRFDQNDGLA